MVIVVYSVSGKSQLPPQQTFGRRGSVMREVQQMVSPQSSVLVCDIYVINVKCDLV